MSLAEAWQRPAADDINPDALEYLLAPKKGKKIDPPWVKIEKPLAPPAQARRGTSGVTLNENETVRLQTTIEVLNGRLEMLATRLQESHCEIGYLKAQLAAKDEQLQQQAEYRARAARAIVSDIEKEKLRSRVEMLEAIIADLERQAEAIPSSADSLADHPFFSSVFSNATAEQAVSRRRYISIEPFIVAFTISFAVLVLATLLS